MNSTIQKHFADTRRTVRASISNLSNMELSAAWTPGRLLKACSMEVPDLDTDHVSPWTGEEVLTLGSAPEGVGVSSSGKPVPFIVYEVPIKGSTAVFTSFIQDRLKRGVTWVNNGVFNYKRFHSDLKSSTEVQESIKADFKQSVLSIKAYLDTCRVQAQAENKSIETFINESITEEVKLREDKSNFEKSLNPFA